MVLTFVIVLLVRRPGHWWGDDWALYVRQADSIFGGGVRDVVADNRFTVERSGLPEFSPPMYPWGYALLLSPFVAVLGTDLDRLVIAQALFFCWFLAAWYRLARPRVGLGLAFGGLLVVALSPQYVRWAELVQSELAFMAVALTALVVLDGPRVRAALVSPAAPWWPLVALGTLGAGAFTVRREGLAVFAAIGVAQLAAIARTKRSPHPPADGAGVGELVGRLAVPYATAVGVVGVSELLLPSTLVPGYRGNGLHNVVRFAPEHLAHIAESVGLRDVGASGPTVLGSGLLGSVAVVAFVVLTVAGVATAARRRPHADLPLVAFTLGALAIGGSFRAPGARYVAVVGAMALLLALMALRELSRRLPRRRVVAATALVLVALVAVGNAVRVAELAIDARRFDRAGEVVWGPDAPESREMFAAVERLTAPDDVIGFFKARAMTQRTNRRAIQVTDEHPIERNLDVLTHVVHENTPDNAFAVAIDRDRYEELWSNPAFTLHRLRF